MTAGGCMRYRLKRLERVYARNPLYFITVCTASRKPLLANNSLQTAFENFGIEAAKRDIHVGKYVLMPDHLHFFVTLSKVELLSDWVKSLKNSLSKTLRSLGHTAPHWQKGFFDHVLRSERSYGEKWLYVRENPVRGGLVPCWDEWPYSGEIQIISFSED